MAHEIGTHRCVFPQFPLQENEVDTRTFQEGEQVCFRDYYNNIRPATYIRPHPQPGTGNVFAHVIFNPQFPNVQESMVSWFSLGKYSQVVSPTIVNKIGQNKGLPQNIEGLLKKYGGKRNKKHTKKRHTKKRKQTRRK